jgi:hypothetical protein
MNESASAIITSARRMDFIDCSSGTDTGAVAADSSANKDSNKRPFALAIIKKFLIFICDF